MTRQRWLPCVLQALHEDNKKLTNDNEDLRSQLIAVRTTSQPLTDGRHCKTSSAVGVNDHFLTHPAPSARCSLRMQAQRHPHDPTHGGKSYLTPTADQRAPAQGNRAPPSQEPAQLAESEDDARSWNTAQGGGVADEPLPRADSSKAESYRTATTTLGTRSGSTDGLPSPSPTTPAHSPTVPILPAPGPAPAVVMNAETGLEEIPVPPKSFGRAAVGPATQRQSLMVRPPTLTHPNHSVPSDCPMSCP